MLKLFIPFAHASSVYEIEMSFFQRNGVKHLFLDLDNTLDSYKLYHPTERAFELIKKIQEAGITPYVISNNHKKRVIPYATELGIQYVNYALKPFPFKLKKFMKLHGIDKNEAMLVGDQVMTDILAGKGAGVRVINTDKIVVEDQFTTRINRIFERPIKKKMIKKGLLIDWRNK